MISLKNAYEILLSQKHTNTIEEIDIFHSLGKILAEDIIATRNLPAFSNSAMDGYVVSEIAKSYKITHTILAGDMPPHTIPQGECYKIMTGAKTPSNALSVIPFENAHQEGEVMIPSQEIKPQANIKLEGEECKKGEVLLKKGERLNYRTLSLIASQGISSLKVFTPLKIAIYASGNEVVELGSKASEEQIYNVNGIAYHSLLSSYGFTPNYKGILSDELERVREEVKKFRDYDVVFTSGGASVGEADFFEKALREEGVEILFHGINLKPGRPMLAGKMENTFIFSLPGNPLSGMLNLITLALPSLFALSGASSILPSYFQATNKKQFSLKNGRSNMILGNFDGEFFEAYRGGKYGSGSILPLKESNAIALFSESVEGIKEGERIKILPLPFELKNGEKVLDWINFLE